MAAFQAAGAPLLGPKQTGPLHDPVTWYKITFAGEQVAQRDFQNNATRTSPPRPAFDLEVPLHNLLSSMCEFVPCDQIVERAYYSLFYYCIIVVVM